MRYPNIFKALFNEFLFDNIIIYFDKLFIKKKQLIFNCVFIFTRLGINNC